MMYKNDANYMEPLFPEYKDELFAGYSLISGQHETYVEEKEEIDLNQKLPLFDQMLPLYKEI